MWQRRSLLFRTYINWIYGSLSRNGTLLLFISVTRPIEDIDTFTLRYKRKWKKERMKTKKNLFCFSLYYSRVFAYRNMRQFQATTTHDSSNQKKKKETEVFFSVNSNWLNWRKIWTKMFFYHLRNYWMGCLCCMLKCEKNSNILKSIYDSRS